MQKNKQVDSSGYLAMFNDFLSHHVGLTFSKNRWSDLELGLLEAAKELSFDNPETCAYRLMASTPSKKEIEILSSYLTIGETYFFREKDSFDIFENQVIPQLLHSRNKATRTLRIWSAACSSGEEPYSIAIILHRKKSQLKGWNIALLATDISIKALEKAEKGIYSEWSFRNTPSWLKDSYFTKIENNAYKINAEIKEMVQFEYLNLAEDIYPSLLNNTNAMDIIFCRNVLMYFLPQKAAEVVHRLYRSLVMKGCLIVSPSDSFHLHDIECFKKNPANPSVYTKCNKQNNSTFESDTAPLHYQELQYQQQPLPGEHEFPLTHDIGQQEQADPSRYHQAPEPESPVDESEALQNNISEIREQAFRLYTEGNYTEVVAHLQSILENSQNSPGPNDPALRGLYGEAYALAARSYANLGQLTEAGQWCGKAIDTDKLNTGFHYLNANILQEQGDREGAIRSLKRCLYIEPDFILAHFTLGIILSHKNEPGESGRHFKIALSLLESFGDQDIVSQEEGITAGRLREIINTNRKKEPLNV